MVKKQKEQLRKEIKQKREQLSKEEIKELSKKVIEKLKNLKEFQNAKTVMLYLPIKGEVDLTDLFEELLNSGKTLLLPKVLGDNLVAVEVSDKDLIKEGRFKIPEPVGGRIFKPEKVDFVAVPGVAFDKKGCRIGFGKGYYDRFLPRVKGFKAGVAYDFQLFEEIPCEGHDVRLDAIITPTRIYYTKEVKDV